MTKTTKEFGQLSADQLLAVIKYVGLLEPLLGEVRSTLAEDPRKALELETTGAGWADLYELTAEQHITSLFRLVSESDSLPNLARANDPLQAALDYLSQLELSDEDYSGGSKNKRHLPTIVHLLVGLLNSVDCVCIYGVYLHELIAIARKGDAVGDGALLKAIRIDPAVVTGRTGARRLRLALLRNETEYLSEIHLAMEGKTGDQMRCLNKFRIAFKALHEAGGLGNSPTALARRLVELGIYTPGPSAVKNASELIRKAMKDNAI